MRVKGIAMRNAVPRCAASLCCMFINSGVALHSSFHLQWKSLCRSTRNSSSSAPGVAAARQRAGMSVAELARATGYSHSALWGIEHGHSLPSLRCALAIAGALHLTLDELIRGAK